MDNSGWIKLYRKFENWAWYHDPKMVQFWIHLLIHVNRTPQQWQNRIISPGSLVIGRSKLAATLGTSEQSVRTCIQRLRESKQITTLSTNRYTIITVVGWEKYQNQTERTTNKKPSNNHQLTTNEPASNQQSTTIQEVKNNSINTIKEVKNKRNVPYADACINLLDKLYPLFPKKNLPTSDKAIQGWAETLEKLHRLDGYPWVEIENVITWARNHESFWSANCLSIAPLRQKSNKTGVSKFQTMAKQYQRTKTLNNGKNEKFDKKQPAAKSGKDDY